MLLEGKKVLVTGASAGIGRAAAIGAARHGADVAINYAGNDAAAAEVVREIEELGRRALAIKGDVAEHATAGAFVSQAADTLGGLDVFVSNAGICPFHAFLDMPPDTVERSMRVNLHGASYLVQGAANRMVVQGRG
ncbi:SDR family NAD(P)-dependent oxidoreductase, partial [Sphingomonas sp. RB1R13]|uniref:SDR family NAD(P)-dependent oxidoreductase n=1 Tax=Sphingomonas sp. RB1R13 TaxID=3096159 RepID=UPI002FC59CE1